MNIENKKLSQLIRPNSIFYLSTLPELSLNKHQEFNNNLDQCPISSRSNINMQVLNRSDNDHKEHIVYYNEKSKDGMSKHALNFGTPRTQRAARELGISLTDCILK